MTPPTIAPVLSPLEVLVGVGDAGAPVDFDTPFVVVGVAIVDAGDVETRFPSTRYKPRRLLTVFLVDAPATEAPIATSRCRD